MSGWNPPSEPSDSREEPECICPPEGPSSPQCPMHAWRAESVYPVIRIRDRQGTLRIGYVERDDPDYEPEPDIEY